MKRALALAILSPQLLWAQIPRAEPVDPNLQANAADVFFERGKNLYDAAQNRADREGKIELYQRAADLFAQYLAEFPNHPNAEASWWYLGNSYYQSGQVDQAKRCFHTLLNRFGEGKWVGAAAYTLAADHYNKAEYAFAAPMFERYAANAGKPEERPRGNYLAGKCYFLLGRDREALASYRKVIDDPAGGLFAPQAKLDTGKLLAKGNKTAEALKQLEEIIANPAHIAKIRGEAALNASFAAAKLKQPEAAEKYLRLILSSPDMEEFVPDAQISLMNLHFERKEYRQVVEIFRRGAGKAEGEKEATRLMIAARSYMALKRPTDSLSLFRQIETLVPPENDLAFRASYYRIHCFFQIEGRHVPDQVDAFLEIYRKARPEDPRIHTALLIKAETLFSGGDAAAAAKVFPEINASVLSEANRPSLFYQRGWCLAEAGDQQGAVRSLSEFIAKYPEDSRVRSALAKRAKAYAEIGEAAKAIVDFDRLTADGGADEFASFAWLESARMRRSEGNIPDMVLRYKGLLGNVRDLSDKLQAEANYWIGWGLVKTNAAKEGISFLEAARKLDPGTYRKHAGILLALSYYALQDPQKLSDEINRAAEGKYEADIPDQSIQWAGMQSYNAQDYPSAARFLGLIANPDEPRETPKEVWRYLAKARLETGDGEGALQAVDHVLAVEENAAWKADGLVDRGRALFLLKRSNEARQAADEADKLRPQGRTKEHLLLLNGDLFSASGDERQAAASYTNLVEFHVDSDLRPLALWKLAAAHEKLGNTAEAQKYREQLGKQYPDWKVP